MTESEQLKNLANELMAKAEQGTTADLSMVIEKVSQALKSLSETEKAGVEIRKLIAEEQKLRYDINHSERQEKLESRQRYITLLSPLATTLVLGLTLVVQTFQFATAERDKQNASEDAQWAEAVKTISQSSKLSPVAIVLNPFIKSRRYANAARTAAIQVLTNTNEPTVFADVFHEMFVPVDETNLDPVLQLDRALGPRLGTLYGKTFNAQTKQNELSRLTDDERKEYEYISGVIKEISKAVVPFLKGRSRSQRLDLASAWFTDCDWSGVDLHDANINNIDLRYADLKGADLGGITSFEGAELFATPWWDANRISPKLLAFLIQYWPYDTHIRYGRNSVLVSQQDYAKAILRLRTTAE